jgi:FkbM family methyltransferase
MFYKRLKSFLSHPEVQKNPVKALLKRFFWRIRWAVTNKPYVIPFADNLKIAIPKSGSGAAIYYQGYSEPETKDFLLRFLQPGMVVLDVGAHIGEYTLLASQAVGKTGQVHAFEPQDHVFPILQENIQMNDFGNVILNCSAVSDRVGKIEFQVLDEPAMSSIRKQENPKTSSTFVEVACTSLDTYCSSLSTSKHPKVDLIKVDVEGAEKFVFQGAESLLRLPNDEAPTWIFEYAPNSYADFNYEPRELLNLLYQNGYEVWQYISTSQIKVFDPNSQLPAIVNLIATKNKTYLLSLF